VLRFFEADATGIRLGGVPGGLSIRDRQTELLDSISDDNRSRMAYVSVTMSWIRTTPVRDQVAMFVVTAASGGAGFEFGRIEASRLVSCMAHALQALAMESAEGFA